MTKEQYNKLVKYEHIFTSAIEAKYLRAMDSHFAADFVDTCRELNIYINTSCPACVLKAAQTLGKLYFDYKAEQQNKPADADPSDHADSLNSPDSLNSLDSSVISDSIDLFEPIEEKLPEPVKTDKPGKTATSNKKASQNANKQAQKKKSK